MQPESVTSIEKQLEALKAEIDRVSAETLGDRNKIAIFKNTLHGRIEALEACTQQVKEDMVTLEKHNKLESAVESLSKTVSTATGVLNKAVWAILGSALGVVGVWIATQIIGGS